MAKIDTLLRICEEATKEPWHEVTIEEKDGTFHFVETEKGVPDHPTTTICDPHRKEDMEFIVAAREWLPRLLREINNNPWWAITPNNRVVCIWCRRRGDEVHDPIHASGCLAADLEVLE